MRRSLFECLLFVFLLFIASALSAQQGAIPVSSVPANLRQVTNHAATIFVGKVMSLEARPLAASDQVGCVQITFQVDKGFAEPEQENISASANGSDSGQVRTATAWASA